MSVEPGREKTGRVLVAFETAPPGGDLLSFAVRLAAELQAELHALFVEDVNLLRGAELPTAQELGPWSATRRPVSLEAMEQSLRSAAEAARRALADAAGQASLSWSFGIVRGSLLPVTLQAIEQADVMLTAARRLAVSASRASHGPTAVVFDGSASADRALQAALRLNPRVGDCVVVLPLAPDETAAASLRRRLEQLADDALRRIRFVSRPIKSIDDCIAAVGDLQAGLLLVGGGCPLGAEPNLQKLLDGVRCPLGFVR